VIIYNDKSDRVGSLFLLSLSSVLCVYHVFQAFSSFLPESGVVMKRGDLSVGKRRRLRDTETSSVDSVEVGSSEAFVPSDDDSVYANVTAVRYY